MSQLGQSAERNLGKAIAHIRCPPDSDRIGAPRESVASGHNRTHAVQHPRPYSITSSARVSIKGETVMPIEFAVLRLSTNSNLVDRMTGRSAGLSPFRIR